MKIRESEKRNSDTRISNKVLSDIYKAVYEISYGSVQIHIQNGKVIQIDKINKVRMR